MDNFTFGFVIGLTVPAIAFALYLIAPKCDHCHHHSYLRRWYRQKYGSYAALICRTCWIRTTRHEMKENNA